MSLLPDSASFHEQVEAFFVAHRGRGISLTSHDLDLVDAWAAQGVPFEVVARGIRKAAEAALYDAPEGDGALRSLRAAKRRVESEIAKYWRQAGSHSSAPTPEAQPFHHERFRRLVAALRKVAKDQPAARPVALHLEAQADPADFEAGNRREELALALLARALPWSERRPLLREARRLVEKAAMPSAAARRASRRLHRAALVRQRWGLPPFW